MSKRRATALWAFELEPACRLLVRHSREFSLNQKKEPKYLSRYQISINIASLAVLCRL
jgi:hypothetical protein